MIVIPLPLSFAVLFIGAASVFYLNCIATETISEKYKRMKPVSGFIIATAFVLLAEPWKWPYW